MLTTERLSNKELRCSGISSTSSGQNWGPFSTKRVTTSAVNTCLSTSSGGLLHFPLRPAPHPVLCSRKDIFTLQSVLKVTRGEVITRTETPHPSVHHFWQLHQLYQSWNKWPSSGSFAFCSFVWDELVPKPWTDWGQGSSSKLSTLPKELLLLKQQNREVAASPKSLPRATLRNLENFVEAFLSSNDRKAIKLKNWRSAEERSIHHKWPWGKSKCTWIGAICDLSPGLFFFWYFICNHLFVNNFTFQIHELSTLPCSTGATFELGMRKTHVCRLNIILKIHIFVIALHVS